MGGIHGGPSKGETNNPDGKVNGGPHCPICGVSVSGRKLGDHVSSEHGGDAA